MKEQIKKAKLEGQIELLEDILNLVFHSDPDIEMIIERSKLINNEEMVETLRALLRKKDLTDVKKMILSL